jgi:hypothetical protein
MDLSIIGLGSAPAEVSNPPSSTAKEEGFKSCLHNAQAPPGPEPPPDPSPSKGTEELQTSEPNAQSKKPDLDPTAEKDAASKGHSFAAVSASGLNPIALLNAAIPTTLGASALEPPKAQLPTLPGAKQGPVLVGPAEQKGEVQVSLADLPKDPSAQVLSACKNITPQQEAAKAADAALKAEKPQPAQVPTVPQKDAKAPDARPEDPAVGVPSKAVVDASLPDQRSDHNAPSHPGPDHQPQQFVNHQPQPAVKATAQAQTTTSAPADVKQSSSAMLHSSQAIQIIREITDHADRLSTLKSAGSVTVHLQTEDFANVTMVVKALKGRVEAQILTDNDQLKNALHQNRPQLTETFQARGMNLSHVSVGSQAGTDSDRQRQPERPRTAQQLMLREADQDRRPTFFAPTRQPHAGVDLWI